MTKSSLAASGTDDNQTYLGIENGDVAAVQVVTVEAILGASSLTGLVELHSITRRRGAKQDHESGRSSNYSNNNRGLEVGHTQQ